jgi:hypothetical protein
VESQELPVSVSRRIEAPAANIFGVLADPTRHIDLDGSGLLRGAVTPDVVTRVGDVFVMAMYYSKHGDYEMNNHVVEFEPNRRIAWEPVNGRGHPDGEGSSSPHDRWQQRWIFDLVPDGTNATTVTEIYDCSRASDEVRAILHDGAIWIEAMTKTLERLDHICTA